jgi:hypothetical protein
VSRTENRVVVRVQRGTLRGQGLEAIIDPSAFDPRWFAEFAELSRAALDAFEAVEKLLDLAARRLVDDFTVEAAVHRELPSSLLVDRTIETVPLDHLQAGIAPSVLGRVAAEASRRNRKSHVTVLITLRLAAHRAVSELERAVREAEPTAEAAYAATTADELIELAERIGFADDEPLGEIWPRLVARVVRVERPKHRLAARESEPA